MAWSNREKSRIMEVTAMYINTIERLKISRGKNTVSTSNAKSKVAVIRKAKVDDVRNCRINLL